MDIFGYIYVGQQFGQALGQTLPSDGSIFYGKIEPRLKCVK
jgi:hypothetical protein